VKNGKRGDCEGLVGDFRGLSMVELRERRAELMEVLRFSRQLMRPVIRLDSWPWQPCIFEAVRCI
jgi:hypothetical protein